MLSHFLALPFSTLAHTVSLRPWKFYCVFFSPFSASSICVVFPTNSASKCELCFIFAIKIRYNVCIKHQKLVTLHWNHQVSWKQFISFDVERVFLQCTFRRMDQRCWEKSMRGRHSTWKGIATDQRSNEFIKSPTYERPKHIKINWWTG